MVFKDREPVTRVDPELELRPVHHALAAFLKQQAETLVPGVQIEKLKIKLLSNSSNVNDPESQEGAQFTIDTREITIRLRTTVFFENSQQLPAILITDNSETSRGKRAYLVGDQELEHDLSVATDSGLTPYLRELTARAVHEAVHSLTLVSLWPIDHDRQSALVEQLTELLEDREADGSIGKQVNDVIRRASYTFWHDLPPDAYYQRSFDTKQELLGLVIPLLPLEERKAYLHTAFLQGVSEILCTLIDDRICHHYGPVIEKYSGFYYAVQRADMALPTPLQQQFLVDLVSRFSLPLSDTDLQAVESLADPAFFEEYLETVQLDK